MSSTSISARAHFLVVCMTTLRLSERTRDRDFFYNIVFLAMQHRFFGAMQQHRFLAMQQHPVFGAMQQHSSFGAL